MHIVIAGCGRVGSELAKLLSSEGHNVVIIDKNQTSFDRLGTTFNGITLLGNGYDPDILKAAGIEKADAFCAVTNGDNTNIMASQVAKKIFKVPKVIARVYDPKRADIYKSLGLDIISGTILFAAMLRDKIIESRFSSYLIETGELGVIEIDIDDKYKGKLVEEINLPGEFLVTTVLKKKQTIIPGPKTVLDKGDKIMAVVKTTSLEKVRKIFGL
ncbi:MAG: TrkA family potassium uptake protein [Candidatus Omnitrophota bacterium]|nr:TrkA family potassium uptake protein [Candidatus Omnitrophota bacterium]